MHLFHEHDLFYISVTLVSATDRAGRYLSRGECAESG